MIQQSSSIEDLGERVDGYVDCYVSTDSSEVEEILVQKSAENYIKR